VSAMTIASAAPARISAGACASACGAGCRSTWHSPGAAATSASAATRNNPGTRPCPAPVRRRRPSMLLLFRCRASTGAAHGRWGATWGAL
jgi:hypothetical protein